MILSTKGRYGLKAMFVLAVQYGDKPIPLSTIAEEQDISVNYLEQLFLPLRKSGLVTSVRGAHGGYMLSKEPSEITVGSVLKVLEGPLKAADCALEDETSCGNATYCVTRLIWEKITFSIDHVIESITLKDMVDDHYKMKHLKEEDSCHDKSI